jgi:hypothetical protein
VPPAPGAIEMVIKFREKCTDLCDKLSASEFPEYTYLGKSKESSNDVKNLIGLIRGVDKLKDFVDKFGKTNPNKNINSVCNDEELRKLVKDVNILINGGGQTTTGCEITNGFKSLGTVFKDAFKEIVKEDIVGYWDTDVEANCVKDLFGEEKTMKVNNVFEKLCAMVD